MTGMLASVTGPVEAHMALTGGADIIDLKDPSNGALGALPLARIQTTVAAVGGRVPTSATVGDLPADAQLIAARIKATAASGVDYVKVGLFGESYFGACIDALAEACARGVRVIGVLFADTSPPLARWIERLAGAGLSGIMLDTADKAGGGLRAHLDDDPIAAFVTLAGTQGLLTGLAGSLKAADIPALLTAQPDYLGFRTALCGHGQRGGDLHATAIAEIRGLIPAVPSALSVSA